MRAGTGTRVRLLLPNGKTIHGVVKRNLNAGLTVDVECGEHFDETRETFYFWDQILHVTEA